MTESEGEGTLVHGEARYRNKQRSARRTRKTGKVAVPNGAKWENDGRYMKLERTSWRWAQMINNMRMKYKKEGGGEDLLYPIVEDGMEVGKPDAARPQTMISQSLDLRNKSYVDVQM